MFSSRSSRRDRVTAAAVSSARWRCCTSARDTGKGNPRRARCTEAALKIIAASLVFFFLYPLCSNILELVEFFEEEDKFYLVFEKLRGGEGTTAAAAAGCLDPIPLFIYKHSL